MRKAVQVTKQEMRYTCDVCRLECEDFQCFCCKRDVCFKCSIVEQRKSHTPERYCQACWNLGAPFRERQSTLWYECLNKVENLQKNWYAKAKAEVKG